MCKTKPQVGIALYQGSYSCLHPKNNLLDEDNLTYMWNLRLVYMLPKIMRFKIGESMVNKNLTQPLDKLDHSQSSSSQWSFE